MPTYIPHNVLITGGAGFIGCHFVRYLLGTDPRVRTVNLDVLTYAGSLENLKGIPDPDRHTVVPGDICDRALVEHLLREHEIDTIVHCAAESHVGRSITGPAAFIQTNVVGTFTLLEVPGFSGSKTKYVMRRLVVFTMSPPMRSTARSDPMIRRFAKPRRMTQLALRGE